MRNAAVAAANMTRCIAGFSRSNTRCNKQTQEKDDLETDRSFFVPGQIYARGIHTNADKISSKNFVEIANTLQRFWFLPSVVYRSAFDGLQSKNECGILRQRLSRSSMKPPKQPFPLFLQDSRLRKANVNETKKRTGPTARGKEETVSPRCGKERI